jgi:hypothetical protein
MTWEFLPRLCVVSLFVILSTPLQNYAGAKTSERQSPARPIQVAMKNVMYHYTASVAAHIVQLQGYLTPTKAGLIVVFDDPNSFILHLNSAEIAISCNSLARVLNENVFSASNAPIKNVAIENKNNELAINGKLPQKGDVTFEATGTLAVDGTGQIRLHTDHLKAAHLPIKGLLDLLGIDLARLISSNQIRGVRVEKDDVILDPEQILPPPHIQGKVTAVRLQGNEIVQIYGQLQASNFAAKQPGNYMAYKEGDLRFGKLTMNDADLILTDMDPSDAFDFYLDHYKEQIVAGYTKTTPQFGLRVYTRDYAKLRTRPARPESGNR